MNSSSANKQKILLTIAATETRAIIIAMMFVVRATIVTVNT